LSTNRKIWAPPGWPWELELLALVFVITALVVPYLLARGEAPTPEAITLIQRGELARQQMDTATLQDQLGFFWAVAIIGVYVVHIALASMSIDLISTSFTHLISPLVFSMITYYRLWAVQTSADVSAKVVSGEPREIALWILAVTIVTILVARIRVGRHMLNFKEVDWDIVTPTKFEFLRYLELIPTVTSLIYPPRLYRASPDGIMIEGWLYVMPIPYRIVASIEPVNRTRLTTSAHQFATTTRDLIRLQLTDRQIPVYISPRDRDAFVHYCKERIAERRIKKDTRTGETAL